MPNDSYRLAMSVTHADGHLSRWGADELSAADVPTGLTFSTAIPGGFKDMSCALLRRLNVDYTDQALFDSVRVYGPGNQTAWEGRMAQFPRQHADQFSVNPGAVGWAVHLRDDSSFREIYVDRDLTHWRPASVTRRLTPSASGLPYTIYDTSVVSDVSTGFQSLQAQFTGAWSTGAFPTVEGWYDSHGVIIGSVYYAWKKNPNIGTGSWYWFLNLMPVDDYTGTGGVDSTANLSSASTTGSGTLVGTVTPIFALANMGFSAAPAGTDGTVWSLWWTCLAVYGTHGLTKQGTATLTSAQGIYGSDAVANIIQRAAPLLTYSTGSDGSIQPTTFVIPQLAFLDPVTAEEAISAINAYHLYEWGVYDNREFFWRPPDLERTLWEARLSDGAQVSLEGDDANNIFNGVFVSYTDPAGEKRTVGPPGSGAVTESSLLVDSSPDNPVTAHGIPRRWGKLDISVTTTAAGAIQMGSVWLAEHNIPTRRGQITLTGLVEHPTKGKRPVWEVRAGDSIRLADRPDDSPRRIIETTYDHDSRRLTASMDNTVFKLDALMERMGVDLIGVV